jgi:peptidoglycan/LPS O-acetylase OafA/YrhL
MFLILNYARKKSKSNIITTFIVFNLLFVSIIVVSVILLQSHFYKFFLWRFFEILFGGFVSIVLCGYTKLIFKETKGLVKFNKYIVGFYKNRFILIASFALYFYFVATGGVLTNLKLNYYLFTIISSVLIVNAAFNYSTWYSTLLSNKTAQYLGKISYGLYLYHWPIYYISANNLNITQSTRLSDSLILDICRIAATLLLSVLSYEFIEKPILKYKDNLNKKDTATTATRLYQEIKVVEKQGTE